MGEDFVASRRVTAAVSAANMVLWYCKWPENGASHLEPSFAPVTGGTELLVHVALPSSMPTDSIIVKFVCKPLQSLNDPDLEDKAPMRRDVGECPRLPYDEL